VALGACEDQGSGGGSDPDLGVDSGDSGVGNDVSDGVEDVGAGPTQLCEEGTRRCRDETSAEVCNDETVGFEALACAPDESCQDGECIGAPCVVGERYCLDEQTLAICGLAGETPILVTTPCGEGERCLDDDCQAQICDPDGPPVCEDIRTVRECDPSGFSYTLTQCQQDRLCRNGVCQSFLCNPGNRTCFDGEPHICDEAGLVWDPTNPCADDEACRDGECLGACEIARDERAYIGCDYTAIYLPNTGRETQNFAVSVANTSETVTAIVTVKERGELVETLEIEPRSVGVFLDSMNLPIDGFTGIYTRAYRVNSSSPVVVYQFNSYETVGAASTDASLLLPDHALTNAYLGMAYTGDGFQGSQPWLAVYGIEEATEVTIIPTAAISASGRNSERPIAAVAAGTPLGPITIAPYEVLLVRSEEIGSDLTGSVVSSDHPVGVFGGNALTQVPIGRRFRDHLEQQLVPRQALGSRYVVGRSAFRSREANDRVRILADVDDTLVQFDPPVYEEQTLAEAQWFEIELRDDVTINASSPIMVGQFLAGSGDIETERTGDPTFILQVPIDQYRADYVFTCPPTYTTDYINLTAPLGASIVLDGAPLELGDTEIGASGYTNTVIVVEDGDHVIVGDQPFGLTVYGYGGPPGLPPLGVRNVSYGYPGGLNLREINPKE
jgi:hypothetical protein